MSGFFNSLYENSLNIMVFAVEKISMNDLNTKNEFIDVVTI